uniref:hypothetical protein n=1 Tax=Aliarcobacter sp. TaxID=2321116 RepID=UPI0040475774
MPPIDETETNSENLTQELNGEESSNQDNLNQETSTSTEEKKEPEEEKKDIKDEAFETAKDSTGGKFDTLTLIQEVAKIEATIETRSSGTVDEKEFYKNLNNYLTDEEMQLKFDDDPSKYLEAVNNAKEKFTKENSIDTSKEQEALAVAQGKLVVAQAIDSVLKDAAYKDFNFVKLQDFYHNDLTKKEQAALDKGSSKDNLPEYFKKIHDEYKKRNPKNVKNVQAPSIPDASNVTKTSIEDKKEIEDEQKRKEHLKKIGFRKL